MEDMKILPDVTSLHLILSVEGHSFGACSFHILRMCSGIKQLIMDLSKHFISEVWLSFICLNLGYQGSSEKLHVFPFTKVSCANGANCWLHNQFFQFRNFLFCAKYGQYLLKIPNDNTLLYRFEIGVYFLGYK